MKSFVNASALPFTRVTIRALLLILFISLAAGAARAAADFPEPAAVEPQVDFWMDIYLRVSTHEGVLHDALYPRVVYETVHFGDVESPRARQRIVDRRKHHWRAVLRRLARGTPPQGDGEQAIVHALQEALGHAPRPRDLRAAADRLRLQVGQREKFRAGLIRSGAWEERMRAIFRHMGLPADLAYLPHVESSFNTHAYSKYGAAGMWQFMRATGRRYLRIDYLVDERLDPIRATRAAARLLRDNYQDLGTWPLAITAYNHGRAGMERAKRVLGTDDIATIIENYRSRSFGFASRNFYPQFLAARRILRSWRTYFRDVERAAPVPLHAVTLPFYADAKDLARHLGLDLDTLARDNPGLRSPILDSEKRIPRDYTLWLPVRDPAQVLAALPADARYDRQRPSTLHRIRSGDTLSGIAAQNHTTVHTLVALNNLSDGDRIYPGQVLHLPVQAAAARAGGGGDGGGGADVHRVRPGEALSVIAERAGTSVDRLVALNNLSDDDRIYAGQVLRLHAADGPSDSGNPDAAAPTAAKGDGGNEAGAAEVHQVRSGEALSVIAQRAGTSVARLVALNNLSDDDRIDAGQVLRLGPGPASNSATDASGGSGQEPASAAGTGSDGGSHPQAAPTGARGTDDASAGEDAAAPAAEPVWKRIDGDSVLVAADETLGHFAEWLGVSTQHLRDLNRLRFRQPLRLHQRLRMDFSRVGPGKFLARRRSYHESIRRAFFHSHRIEGTIDHTVRQGESLWVLCNRVYSIPAWLIFRYNPGADGAALTPGTRLTIPVVVANSS